MKHTDKSTPSDGRSGTGQARPHHGLEDADAPASQHAAIDRDQGAVRSGSSYQSGGTQQDRSQRAEELKQRDGGAGVAGSPEGGADPAPGGDAVRRRV